MAALLLCGTARAGALRFSTDARVDLMGLVQRLSGDQPFGADSGQPGGYGREGLSAFAGFASRPAVERLRRMRSSGFSGSVPAQLALYLSPPPELKIETPVPEFFAQAAGGRAQLDAFLEALRAFARETRFSDWRAREAKDADALAAAARAAAGPDDLDEVLAGYLGVRTWRSLNVVPSPFFPPGKGSYWVVEADRGLPDVYAIIGPEWREGRPRFAPREELASAVWREAAFSTAYAMIDLCRPDLAPAADVCVGTRRDAAEDCVEQIWVEAVAARLRARVFGAREDDPRLLRTRSRYVAPELAALRRYEEGCTRPADLVAYAPALLAPLQRAGAPAPACPRLDLGERAGELYRRRLAWYRQAAAARPARSDRCGRK